MLKYINKINQNISNIKLFGNIQNPVDCHNLKDNLLNIEENEAVYIFTPTCYAI